MPFVAGIFAALLLAAFAPAPLSDSAPVAAVQQRAERLILEPARGTILTVEGRYPKFPNVCPAKQPKALRAKYRGRLEIVRKGNRLALINELSFSHYLRGLAEVPPAWPPAALRAQAIAARSYALAAYRTRSDRKDYDICATDQCQVYRGATVELGAFGERWVSAVESTRGRVLRYRGRIIPAYYFSTSDGRTRRSFPGGTPQPWLPSVSGEDADAPLARWTARFPLADLAAILAHAGEWRGGPLTRAEERGDDIRLSGPRASTTIGKADLRLALNRQAQCVFPERYPGKGTATGKKLPLPVPSREYVLDQDKNAVVLRGRGWGHGVGMSQWGARSLAERGAGARQILKHFYGPAEIASVQEPRSLRVLAADQLALVRLSIDGPVKVRTATGSVLAPGDRFEVRGGRRLQIRRGTGPSLEPVLALTPATTRAEAKTGQRVELRFTLSSPARVRVELRRREAVILRSAEQSFESGEGTMSLELRLPGGIAVEPGEYEAVLEAYDGLDRVRAPAVALLVGALVPRETSPAATPVVGPANRRPLILAAGVLLALVAAASVARFVRR